jgi:hypothetical protein
MLRQAQHARIFVNHFKFISARPEPVEGLRVSFSTACQRGNRRESTGNSRNLIVPIVRAPML